jgi:exodeoxyribonuclease-5
MILSNKQEEGLKLAVQRHRDGEKYTVISGYAGTGKSTLVRFIIDALNVEEDRVCYTSFTGKAAEVLRKKGNKNVSTLHRLLYEHIPRPAGGFIRKKKPMIDYDIVVVDEVSMVPKSLMEVLFTHPCYVICLGDPFQLPPIDKDEDNHLLDHPHIFLDEIMRQAADSEIIQLTMKIRNGESISLFNGDNVKVLSKDQLNTGILTWADQVLVATNAKRQAINNQMRMLYNHGGRPEDGDKVICLRNYWGRYKFKW